MIRVERLSKSFGQIDVLKNINAEIRKGEVVSIIGPSGAGKSTFLRCLNLLDQPTSGSIWIDNVDVLARKADVPKVRQKMNMVFQSFNLVPTLTVSGNVHLPFELDGRRASGSEREWVDELIASLGLADRLTHRPHELSGGQQQRVAIARAVVARPKLILADEPTGNLDSANGEDVMQLLTELNGEGTTIVMVTHSHSHAEYAHRIVNLLDGAVVTESISQVL